MAQTKKKAKAVEVEVDNLLNAREVAEMFRCSPSGVYLLVREGNLPCIRISGRMIRFSEAAVRDWFKNRAA